MMDRDAGARRKGERRLHIKKVSTLVFASCLVAVLSSGAFLVATIDSAQDIVKLRNAILITVREPGVYTWSPDVAAPDFLQETVDPAYFLKELDASLRYEIRHANGDIAKAIIIARHLVDNRNRPAVPIKGDTITSYHRIRDNGDGYCADYTQVFNALAYSAGMAVREWGFSFRGYSGDGHAFNEVFDETLGKWVFIDSFYSFYVVGDGGIPLSVREFRELLVSDDSNGLGVRRINGEKFSFKSDEDAMSYYTRGMESLFMVWGNNVLSYDANPVVQVASKFGRSAEQITAIAAGVHPSIVLEADRLNPGGYREIIIIRAFLLLLLGGTVLGIMSGALRLWCLRG